MTDLCKLEPPSEFESDPQKFWIASLQEGMSVSLSLLSSNKVEKIGGKDASNSQVKKNDNENKVRLNV